MGWQTALIKVQIGGDQGVAFTKFDPTFAKVL